jgi:hypothetical protein
MVLRVRKIVHKSCCRFCPVLSSSTVVCKLVLNQHTGFLFSATPCEVPYGLHHIHIKKKPGRALMIRQNIWVRSTLLWPSGLNTLVEHWHSSTLFYQVQWHSDPSNADLADSFRKALSLFLGISRLLSPKVRELCVVQFKLFLRKGRKLAVTKELYEVTRPHTISGWTPRITFFALNSVTCQELVQGVSEVGHFASTRPNSVEHEFL